MGGTRGSSSGMHYNHKHFAPPGTGAVCSRASTAECALACQHKVEPLAALALLCTEPHHERQSSVFVLLTIIFGTGG